MKKNNGFSLIELVMVIMFLGIISVMAAVAVDKVLTKANDEASLATKKMLVTMIEDYLVDDYTAGSSTDNCVVDGANESCQLKELLDNGYLKSGACDSVKKKKINLQTTSFTVVYDSAKDAYYCSNCSDLANFQINLTSDTCGG